MKIANKRGSVLVKLGIGCLVCLLLGFGVLLYAQEKAKSEFIGTKPGMNAAKMKEIEAAKMQAMAKAKEQPDLQRNDRSWGRQDRGERVDFGENTAFYKTIVNHNLFRPLGWTPPNNEPSYSLVGTAVEPNGAISQATLLEKRSNRYHFVTIGTKVGDMTVTDIQAKQVTLDKAGEAVKLKTGGFQPLTVSRERGGDRGGNRDEGGSEKAGNNEGQNRSRQMADAKRRQMEQKERAAAQREQLRRDIMEKMRHASSDGERKEIMEYYKKEFGGKSGRDK